MARVVKSLGCNHITLFTEYYNINEGVLKGKSAYFEAGSTDPINLQHKSAVTGFDSNWK
ncbi:hypothetical protein [Bacillus sp. S3]|uniref:hypothetical protein n=1 Tax=Bacillus sp. S3 TaxID=486398 RepID=UPI001681A107|nr:hypothetical protein [Bacillus sp. S3]